MSIIRDRDREREKMEKDREKERERLGKERDNSPTNKRVKAGDRPHHPSRDNGSDPKAKSGGGDDRGREDERRGGDEGKNKREDRLKGGYDRTKSGDDLRGERKEERSLKPSNGGERVKGGVDDRSRIYNSVGKSWKEKGEKEDNGSARAVPMRGGDVIFTPPQAGSSKHDPDKRRSMVAADLPSSVKRDLAAGSKTETALERIVKDINTQKHARPGSTHYVSTSTNNNVGSDANDMKLREVSTNESTTGEEESRRLVWRKNHSGGAPPAGGSMIMRPSEPMNSREPYAKEWRKSREVAQSSMARDTTVREPTTTTTTAAREPPIPGIGGPAMPSSVKPGPKYDLLAPMRESIALRAKAEGDLANQQKTLAEVKELRAKVKQLEKALKQEREESRRYKSQLDLLRGDIEDVLTKAAARAREENGTTMTEQKLPKQRFSLEVEGEQPRMNSRERPAQAPPVPGMPLPPDTGENHQNPAPVRPLSYSASAIASIPTTSTPSPPVPTPTPLSAALSSAPTPSLASSAPVPAHKPTTRRVSQGPTAGAASLSPVENTTSGATGAPHAHFEKPTASTPSHTHAERPLSASNGKPAAASDQTSQATPSTPFGNTPATRGLNCFTVKRYWPKEKEKESLVAVFHTAGIRIVKPFTEEVVEDLKWEQALRWSVNEDEQSFRFFVESRSTSALINHTYETEEIKEISQLVAKLTDRDSGDEGGKQSSDSIAPAPSNDSGSTPAVAEKRNSFENESRPLKKASLLKKFSSFHRRKRSVIINEQ